MTVEYDVRRKTKKKRRKVQFAPKVPVEKRKLSARILHFDNGWSARDLADFFHTPRADVEGWLKTGPLK